MGAVLNERVSPIFFAQLPPSLRAPALRFVHIGRNLYEWGPTLYAIVDATGSLSFAKKDMRVVSASRHYERAADGA
jgi:hypothetical protein